MGRPTNSGASRTSKSNNLEEVVYTQTTTNGPDARLVVLHG